MKTTTAPVSLRYTSVLVALSANKPNDAVLQSARALATLFDADVMGVAACSPPQMVYGDGFGYDYGALIQGDLTRIEQQLVDRKAEFEKCFEGYVGSMKWLSKVTLSSPADYIASHAGSTDLLICAAPEAGTTDASQTPDVGTLILQVGRPVLVVPSTEHLSSGAQQNNPFSRIMICWKDSRATRRSVSDALPLLQKAQQVTLVEIAPEADTAAAHARLNSVQAWLAGHDVAAIASVSLSTGDDALRLHALADETGADLIVGGAYGHSRLREWVLGGVTRDFLLKSDRLALLSH